MKLTRAGIKDRAAWEKAGITLPVYDVEAVSEKAKKELSSAKRTSMGSFWHRKHFPCIYWRNCGRTSGRRRHGPGNHLCGDI